MRTRFKTAALAASAAAMLAAAPAMATGDMDKQSADAEIKVPEQSAATDEEKDALAHRAADENGASPADPALSKNVDQNDDGDLIATGEDEPEGGYDGSVSENVDQDGDGNLIVED
ncbi:hypothetical protein C882_1539 [Caenispirillum salinarum AK4]|uniref:Uncharacterized protein n=1 Tax=Caenispirillum salinarum AK4 TaxID=1238182 RepID=K9H576_9PROT|nr:hypothetical protein [Caenispirillum salinarum]EKV32702.1 hypothetical protein C882_1539 [Caenispirillum salinarum AK4]